MKVLVLFISLLFFATQIIPIKYIGYSYASKKCSVNCNDCSDEDEIPLNAKGKKGNEVYLSDFFHRYYLPDTAVQIPMKFPIFSSVLPDDYISNVIVPPPNC